MPKRSNEFQKLVRLLERQLAPQNAIVEESKLLTDQTTGQSREVDIHIQYDIGQHSISMAIECKNHKRKIGAPEIEQLKAQYEDLPIDKVIVVSKSGFFKPAIKKAEANNIKLLTFEKAIDKDWLKAIKHPWEINFRTVRFKPVETIHGFSQGLFEKNSKDIRVFNKGDELGSLDDFSRKIIYEPIFKQTLTEELISNYNKANKQNIDGQILEVTWTPSKKFILKDDYKFKCKLEEIDYSFQCLVKETSISTDRFTYDKAQIATATKKHLGMKMIFSLIESKDQDPMFAVEAELEGSDGNNYTYEIMTNPLPLNNLSVGLVGFIIG